jgi:hypothetical protein
LTVQYRHCRPDDDFSSSPLTRRAQIDILQLEKGSMPSNQLVQGKLIIRPRADHAVAVD